jgi:hypothetical protein
LAICLAVSLPFSCINASIAMSFSSSLTDISVIITFIQYKSL